MRHISLSQDQQQIYESVFGVMDEEIQHIARLRHCRLAHACPGSPAALALSLLVIRDFSAFEAGENRPGGAKFDLLFGVAR